MYKGLLSETNKRGRRRWLRVDEGPFSRVFCYKLIDLGLVLKANKTGPNVANPVTDGKSGRPFVDFLAWSACTLVADQLVGHPQEVLSTISANGGAK